MKKVALVVGGLVIALLAWLAAGTPQVAGTRQSSPVEKARTTTMLPKRIPIAAGTPSPMPTKPLAVPVAPPSSIANGIPAPVDPATVPDTTVAATATPGDPARIIYSASTSIAPRANSGAPRPLLVPVSGIDPSSLHDMFDEVRGNRRHEAIDLLAPRGTPVIATDDGVVKKLFTSVPGGLTIYQFDPDETYCYYYAHLDHYTAGLHEGQHLQKGEVIAYVGTTGNAPKETPHLHFAVIRLDPDKRWWKGTYINPYPLLYQPRKR
jgi:murein DD-endopeptidase MepM/ murein hydrolase activator NlpD